MSKTVAQVFIEGFVEKAVYVDGNKTGAKKQTVQVKVKDRNGASAFVSFDLPVMPDAKIQPNGVAFLVGDLGAMAQQGRSVVSPILLPEVKLVPDLKSALELAGWVQK